MDALSLLYMGSVAHTEENEIEFVQYVHRLDQLDVHLVDSTKGVVLPHNGSESSFVADVKDKQGLDTNFLELKEVVLKKLV